MTTIKNPLLNNLGLPAFDSIKPEHVQSAVEAILQDCDAKLSNIEQNITPSWDALVQPLEDMQRQIRAVWGPVSHLINVKNSQALRDAYNEVLPKVISFSLKFSQSQPIYEGLRRLKESGQWQSLPSSRQRIIEKKLQAAELSGIQLTGEKRQRFNKLSHRLSELTTTFSNNVMDATKDFELIVTRPEDLSAVPHTYKAMWADSYNKKKKPEHLASAENGPWAINLDFPSFDPFMRYCPNRELREALYRGYVSKASSGPYDNTSHMYEILKLRREQAELLGYSSYAAFSMDQKMAGSVDRVDELLSKLRDASHPYAVKEANDLRAFAASEGLKETFQNWDFQFYAERLRQKLFDFSDEEVRPYFPLPKVLSGLFKLVHTLFGIEVRPSEQTAAVWHPDVSFYDIYDENGFKIASFFLDPYSRPEDKGGGAWMDTCIDRGIYQGKLLLPVAYLICNGTPPSNNQPSMLGFREVETLFHEFGHGLQHMLTTVDDGAASGINGIEWDAVELPSQFMENWCYHKPTLLSLTEHVDSKEQLPDELFDKIAKARTFHAAIGMTRQLHFGMVDMELHHRFDLEKGDIFATNQTIASQVSAFPPIPDDRFLCSFRHIFAGGYAAGYYSYKWAEVLSADAFSRFEENNLDNEKVIKKIGKEFRETVLALGGSEHPMAVFKKFRGREPEIEALLRHSNLSA